MGNLTIMTKQVGSETGWNLKFNHLGTLTSKEKVQKNDGTQVIVRDLFKDLPVRQIEFKKTHKTQYSKCLQLL